MNQFKNWLGLITILAVVILVLILAAKTGNYSFGGLTSVSDYLNGVKIM